MRRNLEVWKMGTVNYLEALKLQEKMASERKALKITDTLLSLQHPPTYTVGKRETVHNLRIPDTDLKAIGAELHYTQRGGDITFHGPHQAILYPIVSLRDIGLGARKYVEKLELTMIELASMYGVKAQVGNKCETGVWVEDRKIGAIGVRISSGITSHGLAFNMDPDLNYFKHIVPCGIMDKDVTSLRKEADVELPAEEVIQEQLISCFIRIFGYNDVILKDKHCSFIDQINILDEQAMITKANMLHLLRIKFEIRRRTRWTMDLPLFLNHLQEQVYLLEATTNKSKIFSIGFCELILQENKWMFLSETSVDVEN